MLNKQKVSNNNPLGRKDFPGYMQNDIYFPL